MLSGLLVCTGFPCGWVEVRAAYFFYFSVAGLLN
jgi:hypothetical protein